MRLCSTILAPVLSIALVACGRSSPAAPAAEIEQLRVLATGVVASTEAYVARAEAMADRAACRTARATYDAQVRPRIEGMVALAPKVDRWLQARGPDEHADTGCAAATMLDELERHLGIACSFPDLAANRTEAVKHLEAMDRWAGPRGRARRGSRRGHGPRRGGARGGRSALRPLQRRDRDVPAVSHKCLAWGGALGLGHGGEHGAAVPHRHLELDPAGLEPRGDLGGLLVHGS